ncbi:MAG: BCD family MFS transporter [Pseudomonadota bacterium]
MMRWAEGLSQRWRDVAPALLPFADVASEDLPLSRLLRLSLFQFSVGMAVVLLSGTLNRVMIVELGIPAALVAIMVALPLLAAPFRALIGFNSDNLVSHIGWRRVPFIWFGTMMQFGGFAFMPFALFVMSGDTQGPIWVGHAAAALAFLLVGAGLHTTQTAGLALATDVSPKEERPRVVALLFVMLLVGMLVSALIFGQLLQDFTHVRLIRVIQGAAMVTLILNVTALWKQETIDPTRTQPRPDRPKFSEAWQKLREDPRSGRLLLALGIGTTGFTMQDILLEPYGAEILGMGVAATTQLTATLSAGMLLAFFASSRWLSRGTDPQRLAAFGALLGAMAFLLVAIVSGVRIQALFQVAVFGIGVGAGLFSVGMLVGAMDLARVAGTGLALGAWGAVQATATGIGVAAGGALRDVFGHWIELGRLGPAITDPATGYTLVYQFEVFLLFVTLVVVGPLAKFTREAGADADGRLGLTEFPQ